MGLIDASKLLSIKNNVCIKVYDEATHKVISQHIGHNAATNSLFMGIGHYLMGETVLNQGDVLRRYLPQYISLGTMGLINQDEDIQGLPAGIGVVDDTEEERFKAYMRTAPGYGSDGYDRSLMNGRAYPGLGPAFADRSTAATVNCELISTSFPRSKVSFRNLVPENESEMPKTIDIVYSALISTGALAQFREPGRDYIFITEAGLWSRSDWVDSGTNGLLAGYRIFPQDKENWDMSDPANRQILKHNIIKVKVNQIVQVVWKIQLGAIEQFEDMINM